MEAAWLRSRLLIMLTLDAHSHFRFLSAGDKFYGPGKSYAPLAGKDATRALGTFEIDNVKGD